MNALVYIWTLLGLSWLGGLISLIVDSASKVSLKPREEMEEFGDHHIGTTPRVCAVKGLKY